MSRERFIHPEILESEDWHSLTCEARVLFVSLIAMADDVGRGKASERSLIGTVYSGIVVKPVKFRKWRDELSDRNMVRFYVVDGSPYYFLPAWDRYQKPRYVKASKLPEYQPNFDICTDSVQNLPDSAGITARVGLGREGKGGEGLYNGESGLSPSDGFEEWWAELRPWFKAMNRRLAYKQDALKEWRKMRCSTKAGAIIDRTVKQRSHWMDSNRSGQRPIQPQDPHRYLKNRRFNDEI